MSTSFIADGYTLSGQIEGCEFHPSLGFEYRPMLPLDRAALLRRIGHLEPQGDIAVVVAEHLVFRELARRLVSWTLLDLDGLPLGISAESLRGIETHLLAKLTTVIFRMTAADDRDDAVDAQNLVGGVRLLLTAPRLAVRDCSDCQQYVYDERTGRRQIHAGHPVVRPPGTHAPCRLPHVGCLKGTPENSRALTAKNEAAYRHYRECRAVGAFPDDPIVRRNAALIGEAGGGSGRVGGWEGERVGG